MTREELIEVGAKAIFGPDEEGPSETAEQMRAGCWSLAEDILDAVEPLIRADERERRFGSFVAQVQRDERDGLRAKVESLPYTIVGRTPKSPGHRAVAVEDVLALIDGGSDEPSA